MQPFATDSNSGPKPRLHLDTPGHHPLYKTEWGTDSTYHMWHDALQFNIHSKADICHLSLTNNIKVKAVIKPKQNKTGLRQQTVNQYASAGKVVCDLDLWTRDIQKVISIMANLVMSNLLFFIKAHPCIPERRKKMIPKVLIYVVLVWPWPLTFDLKILSLFQSAPKFDEIWYLVNLVKLSQGLVRYHVYKLFVYDHGRIDVHTYRSKHACTDEQPGNPMTPQLMACGDIKKTNEQNRSGKQL